MAAPQRPPESQVQGDTADHGDVDNRPGAAQPDVRRKQLAEQGSTTVRWNKYGTPATLTPKPEAQRRSAALADPVAIAKAYLAGNQVAFGLSDQSIGAMDVLVNRPMGQGSYVMLRQRFGELPSMLDGLAVFGIRDGAVVYLSSTLSPNRAAPEAATISPEQALAAASADAQLTAEALGTTRVQLGAVPMPEGAPRAAYQVVLISNDQDHPSGFTTYVDARTGQVLVREDIVDHHSDNPEWDAFPANPPADYSSRDNRVRWCLVPGPGCERTVSTADRGIAWDIDPATDAPSLTTSGNSAKGWEKWDNLANGTIGTRTATPSPTRDYTYPWTNQWHTEKCNPSVFSSPQQNDIDAALANLFASHNRMHDWPYHLGFTEETWNMQATNGDRGGLGGDAERGNAQAGGRAGGAPPGFPSRNNANQATPPDGVPPTTNMYLWQPTPGGFYAPCVDGDYDMSVIGHEYSHAISGRLIAGPNSGWSGAQGGAMNESHSDLFAMEYLYEYGFKPRGDTPYVTGGYATGDRRTGIRNYDMSKSELNYSNIAYDLVGQQVHADGEIWSSTSFDVRQAMIDKYGLGTPELQRDCADGKVPVEKCPGNRRWVQQAFDALLLNASGAVSYIDMRDATLAANQIRFGGADLPILWNAFAQHGLGRDAASNGGSDADPTPSFASPHSRNGTLRLAVNKPARLYVGDYEARSVPVADTDPATPLPDSVEITPGTYNFIVAADGYGSTKVRRTVHAGERGALHALLLPNVASRSQGATAIGDGVNADKLIDETEASNWASVGSPVAGKGVRVDLAGDRPRFVSRVQVSAQLRPQNIQDADPDPQNRFTALRQFEILACNSVSGKDCADPANYRKVYTSPANAFPADAPRPTAPDLAAREFRIQPTVATHLMVRVVTNQCTGAKEYAGSQHNDPRSTSDCTTGNPAVAQTVRIAELQAFAF
ncbi:Peptidase propeptide and YPEB domain-containing protein [Kibdelosporangium sp. 4NS15]|uniref:Peptidase propeptide and YPEB domain-containing protein n=1 Tax=Kibdelosporangium persicum TaxID=2698649 RepID=A0ABX2F1U4_9PSEU|nr:M36 family metallopeptidase [Kibdelosporangium persicum]NRN65299.1 Peptidase propeptide and YPEB domain-containing protein [Kibdelosporangium persicum]